MDHHSQAALVIVSGPRRSGKSTFARELVRELAGERLLVLDPLGEHSGRLVDLPDLVDWINRGGGRGRWRLRSRALADGGNGSEADLVLRLVWELPPVTIFVDEADLLRASEGLDILCRFGRHSGHPTILCTRRPADLPPTARANASRMIVFRHREKLDTDYLRAVLPDGCMADHDRLPRFGFLDVDLERGLWRMSRTSPTDGRMRTMKPAEEGSEGGTDAQAPEESTTPGGEATNE